MRDRPENFNAAGDLAGLAPAGTARDVEERDDEDAGRRGKDRERRRAGGGDEVAKEMRKALKRAKDKAPRLVDVLTGP